VDASDNITKLNFRLLFSMSDDRCDDRRHSHVTVKIGVFGCAWVA
jgi:hypothetical protein